MDTVKILLTGVGCPGAVTLIKALRNNGETDAHIIGTDMRPDAAGRWFVDEFFCVLSGGNPNFIGHMQTLAAQTKPDVILPQITNECVAWSLHKDEFDCPVMIADPAPVAVCIGKDTTYQALQDVARCPEWHLCDNLMEFVTAVKALGYPAKSVCFKPVTGKGMRGFHVIIGNGEARARMLLEGRPGEMPLTLADAFHLLGHYEGRGEFPPLLVMEYVEGPEHCVDVFCDGGRVKMGFAKTRENFRAGLAYKFQELDLADSWEPIFDIVGKLGLDGFANIQFRGSYLMEVNPRISTMLIGPGFNMPWLAVKYTLGVATQEELATANRSSGQQISVRYHDQIFLRRTHEQVRGSL